MESLEETKWDVVISGTGLHQSLLALALSRSGKNILHIDSNGYYGGNEAALALQDVEEWVEKNKSSRADPEFLLNESAFSEAELVKTDQEVSSSRGYNIALAPQIIHTKSKLLDQLVSSKAFRQIDFLAVGVFNIFQPASTPDSKPTLRRIPSTREDVFSNTSIPARAKRSLMKFLKFVLEYDSEPQKEVWLPHAEKPLAEFLASHFKLDEDLQIDVITLTLSLDGTITVADGLAAINRHMTSMGLFGAGFAAVYPSWGGLAEVAQVSCRAGAVGDAVYVLGQGLQSWQQHEGNDPPVRVGLPNDITVPAETLVQEANDDFKGAGLARLTAAVSSSLPAVFEAIIEDAPTPAVAVVAFPPKHVHLDNGESSQYPIYAMLHSSDTNECPPGQSLIYLSTMASPKSKLLLERALNLLLDAVSDGQTRPRCLFRLSYEQRVSSRPVKVEGRFVELPTIPLDLAFNDSVMDDVKKAWDVVTKDDELPEGVEYMKFVDRNTGEEDLDD